MADLHETTPLCFECTGCGACCSGGPDHYVYVSLSEAEAIRHHLGVSAAWFRRRYLRRTEEGERVLGNGSGPCVFLGPDQTCRIYAVRPLQCRTYPFWPELLQSRAAWRREAARCEGMDRGAVVPVARIRAALARQRRAEE